VRDAIDTLNHCPHDRVMQKSNARPIYQCEEQNSGHVELTAVAHVIAGIRTSLINRGLAYAAGKSAPNGITLNVFDGLAYLPRDSEAPEDQRLPLSAAALRNAATEARAAITQTRVIEPITATTLHEAVTKLTELAKPNAGNKSGQQYVPDLIAEQTSEMEPRGAFRAASADESEVDCLRRELAKAKAQLEALGGDTDIA
jgi:hypothetical protein